MCVAAVGCDDVIIFSTERNSASGYGFLTDVEVEETTHFSLRIWFLRALLKSTHPGEGAVDIDLILRGKLLVDGVSGVVWRSWDHIFIGKLSVSES